MAVSGREPPRRSADAHLPDVRAPQLDGSGLRCEGIYLFNYFINVYNLLVKLSKSLITGPVNVHHDCIFRL